MFPVDLDGLFPTVVGDKTYLQPERRMRQSGLFETNNVYDSGVKEDKNFPAIWVSKESTARLFRNRVYGTGFPDIYLESPTKSFLSGNDVGS